MNPITKKAYKFEFETSNISLQELIDKYQITKEELGNTTGWKKRELPTSKPAHKCKEKQKLSLVEEKTMLEEIQDTKVLVLATVKEYFGPDGDSGMASTKEIKDMVGVLKDLESGELLKDGKGQGPTVNILIQNLAEKFKDDC